MLPLPLDTRRALGLAEQTHSAAGATVCESRSLLFDRYANPQLKEEERSEFFRAVAKRPARTEKSLVWRDLLTNAFRLNADELIFAQLQSRFMVNMAGGVMENAGLCLDRFGLPYIPGSAVKGCARRAALAALREWCETSQKPGVREIDHDNVFKTACEPFVEPYNMLVAIARVFGWCEQDWKIREHVLEAVSPRRGESDEEFTKRCDKLWAQKRSDFAWASGDQWPKIREATLEALGNALILGASDASAVRSKTTAQAAARGRQAARAARIKDFAGSISFMPAYPVELGKSGKVDGLSLDVPALGKLELDVVTCHHQAYYASTSPNAAATDTEDPNPVVFPAVAPGHVFAFAMTPLRAADTGLAKQARSWLELGLSTFGLGAKTNAGYGWFDCCETVQKSVRAALLEAQRKQRQEKNRAEEEQRRKMEEEERRRKSKALKAATANMTLEQKADFELAELTDDQFRGRLDQFAKREKSEQEAMVRAMRSLPGEPGSRRKFWDDLKAKAQKGGKPAQIEQAIRELSKQKLSGKEGKMP